MADNATSWPAVTLLSDTWLPETDHLSRTQRLKNRGAFTYAQPALIATADPNTSLSPTTTEAARSATSLIERFDESSRSWGLPFASVLLRSESASSSQIEQLTASSRRIALAALGDRSSRNATLISRNVTAMQTAIALAERLDHHAILEMHRVLGGGEDEQQAGRYRQEWVWIGGQSPVPAAYVAPHHDQITSAIDDLLAFMARIDIEPLTQAAIAHAQFETIHPFTDGNGRVGRALVSAALRRRGVSTAMTAPVSAGLLADTASYFAALSDYRAGDPEPIVRLFADAAERAVANADELRRDATEVHESVMASATRRTRNIERLADLCSSEPAFNITMAVEAGITAQTAYRLCRKLVDQRILRRERSIGGTDAWTVVALTEALDRFAQRAGRRTFHQPGRGT